MAAPQLGPSLNGMTCLEKLGAGGFSDVFAYERERPRGKVAVKLMKPDVLDATQHRQFMDEADVMAALSEHPYIVGVIEAGTAPDGRPYLVMPLYPAPDLGERVRNKPLSVAETLQTGVQLCSAVETAHRNGIVHRDIKPANILLSSYGDPGLTDFGIAGRVHELHDHDDNLGVSMPWSAPEVLVGQSNGSVSSDVYSLGATLWHLLVGRSPFTILGGDNHERALFSRILHGSAPSTGRADVPSSLDRLLSQAMSKQPDHRPRSALELGRHLQAIQQELRLARTELKVLDTVVPTTRQHDGEDATRQRPLRVPPADPEATSRRQRTVVTQPQPGPSTQPVGPAAAIEAAQEASSSRWFRMLFATGLLLVAVTGGLLLANRGSDRADDSTPPSSGPASPGDVVAGGGTTTLAPPEIVVRSRGGKVVFSWDRDQPDDRYAYRLEGGGTEITDRASVTTSASRDRTCIEVFTIRGADQSQQSSTRCAPGGA